MWVGKKRPLITINEWLVIHLNSWVAGGDGEQGVRWDKDQVEWCRLKSPVIMVGQ